MKSSGTFLLGQRMPLEFVVNFVGEFDIVSADVTGIELWRELKGEMIQH
jgi:hypothetical protein